MLDMNGNVRNHIYVQYSKHDECYAPGWGICKALADNYNRWAHKNMWKDGLFEDEITITQLMLAGF